MTHSVAELLIGNSNLVRVPELVDERDDSPIDSATVTARVQDVDGNDVAGQTWPVTLAHVPGTDSEYQAALAAGLSLTEGEAYIVLVEALYNGGKAHWEITARARVRRQ